MKEPMMEETSEETADTGSEVSDSGSEVSEGYCIKLYVTPEGFRVSSAEPMSHEGTDDEHAGDTYPDLKTALKHIVAEVKANPVSHDANAEFAAGYAEGPGAAEPSGAY